MVFDYPAVDDTRIDVDAALFHAFCDGAQAQELRQLPEAPYENDLRWESPSFEASRHDLVPS